MITRRGVPKVEGGRWSLRPPGRSQHSSGAGFWCRPHLISTDLRLAFRVACVNFRLFAATYFRENGWLFVGDSMIQEGISVEGTETLRKRFLEKRRYPSQV